MLESVWKGASLQSLCSCQPKLGTGEIHCNAAGERLILEAGQEEIFEFRDILETCFSSFRFCPSRRWPGWRDGAGMEFAILVA